IMCLKYLNEQFKAYDDLKKRFGPLFKKHKIVCVVVACLVCLACAVCTVCVYINGPYPFNNTKSGEVIPKNGNRGDDILSPDDYQKKYDEKVVEFDNHLKHAERTKNGIKELESALSILNEIKELEIGKGVYIKDKKTIQLTEDFKETCDELKRHFNEMRFCDYEDVKRDGEQLYNAVENIKKKL
ncbi:MAG: hypothetical protein HDQ88_06560, partial [Clostridia bacterium]|nr:hypothetical protein [Clostridia bacterium]